MAEHHGHFTNDSSRHRDHPLVIGLLLYDQAVPHAERARDTTPLQEGTSYGQAQIVPANNIVDAEVDSFSLAHIGDGLQNPVEASPSLEELSPALQQGSFGVIVRAETNSQASTVDEGQRFRLSASGFSQTNMNIASPQMQALPSDDLPIALNRQATTEPSEQCMVVDHDVGPVVTSGLVAQSEKWQTCYNSFKEAGFDDVMARHFADQSVFHLNVGNDVKCMDCKSTGDLKGRFNHTPHCPIVVSAQTSQNNEACGYGNGVRQRHSREYERHLSEKKFLLHEDTRGSLAVSGAPAPAPAREAPAERQSPDQLLLPAHIPENAILPPNIDRLPGQQNPPTERIGEQQLRPENVGNADTGIENTSVKRLEAQQGARYPKFEEYAQRFFTFCNIPNGVRQTPQLLAHAGLFYTGKDDICKCFHCGGVIRRWEPNDIPLDEHIKLYPNCAFAKQMKEQSRDQVLNTAARNENIGAGGANSRRTPTMQARGRSTSESMQYITAQGAQGGGDRDILNIDGAIHQVQDVYGYARESVSLAVDEYWKRLQDGRFSRSDNVTSAIVEILTEMQNQQEPLPLTVQGDTPSLAGGANSRMTPTVQARGPASSVSMQHITAQGAQGGGDRDMPSQQYVSANSIGTRPNSMDASYCIACKSKPATISQLECRHIVCRDCAPFANDKSGLKLCKKCNREVVECNAIDVSCCQNKI